VGNHVNQRFPEADDLRHCDSPVATVYSDGMRLLFSRIA